jgi:hypothetical protein
MQMGGDGDPSDSLGQLERLLVVLGMRVGSRSQAIWGVILLAFNTYRVRRTCCSPLVGRESSDLPTSSPNIIPPLRVCG